MKNYEVKVMVEKEIKLKLIEKSKSLGLSLTGFIEKIANEPVIFLDANAKAMIEAFSPIFPKKYKNKNS
jgi:hypothetical protein